MYSIDPEKDKNLLDALSQNYNITMPEELDDYIDPYVTIIDRYSDAIFMGECPKKPYIRKQPDKQLREYTWKGHTVMAYSKADARNRIKAQLAKGE